MSLPQFDVQGSLFESLGAIAPELFSDNDKYKLFAKKVWPVLAQCREQLVECYQADNGRPGVEPVVLLGVLIPGHKRCDHPFFGVGPNRPVRLVKGRLFPGTPAFLEAAITSTKPAIESAQASSGNALSLEHHANQHAARM
jgi:hypothetical protein